ncbi:unnamed protein product [Amoebophrya sp. A120]|nr:unnamed protein product [Amoebophrya sp. A120]|eukprot:GSA120T00025449001.1
MPTTSSLAHKFRFSYITLPLSIVLAGVFVFYTFHKAKERKREYEADDPGGKPARRSSSKYNRSQERKSPEAEQRKTKAFFWTLKEGKGTASAREGDLISVYVEAMVDADRGKEVTLTERQKRQSFRIGGTDPDSAECRAGGAEAGENTLQLGCVSKVQEGLLGVRVGETRKVLVRHHSGRHLGTVPRDSPAVLRVTVEDLTDLRTLEDDDL